MPRFVLVFTVLLLIGAAARNASAQAMKEFQAADGFVRITAAPASLEPDSLGNIPATLELDTLTELAVLQTAPDAADALLEFLFQDRIAGNELRFPAKISHVQGFLAQHAGEFAQTTPDARTVAIVRALAEQFSVHMLSTGTGGGK